MKHMKLNVLHSTPLNRSLLWFHYIPLMLYPRITHNHHNQYGGFKDVTITDICLNLSTKYKKLKNY